MGNTDIDSIAWAFQERHGDFSVHFEIHKDDPHWDPWTVEVNDTRWGGFTLAEALNYADTELSGN